MSSNDFSLADVEGWEWDLHGIYSAYMGYFQSYNIAWYDRSWGHLFATFDAFLGFNWPVLVITDARTGRGHIVTRASSVQAFVRMIKTRFGENMPLATDNMTPIVAYEHNQRQLRQVADLTTYKKLHATLPAAVLAALRSRVRHGNPKEIARLWHRRDMTFLALDFEWSEKSFVTLEMGYAAIRSAHLEATGVWPPVPDNNYRKGHYIIQETVDKIHNRLAPTFPWDYAWGESALIPKAKLPEILQALIVSLASPDSESTANSLVIVTSTPQALQERLHDLKVKLPSNVLTIDLGQYDKALRASRASTSQLPPGIQPNQPLPLPLLVASQNIPVLCPFNNSGNDAFYTLLAFQYLVDPENTRLPPPRMAKKDAHPMVAAQPPTMPMLGMNAMATGFDLNGTLTSRRMSGDDFMAPTTWHTRMGKMNGSMPSLFAASNGRSTPMNGSSSGPRGRPPALTMGASDRKSGSMPRPATTNGHMGTGGDRGGGSDPTSLMGQPDSARRSSSKPKLRSPNSGGSVGHQRRTTSDEDFQPPQAPFAREAFLKNNPSRNRRSSSYSSDDHHRGDGASPLPGGRPSPTSPTTPNSGRSTQPSITVTEHGKKSGDRSSGSVRSGTVSLNETKEKRPQPDVVGASSLGVKMGKDRAGGGGFLSNTFRRLSIKP